MILMHKFTEKNLIKFSILFLLIMLTMTLVGCGSSKTTMKPLATEGALRILIPNALDTKTDRVWETYHHVDWPYQVTYEIKGVGPNGQTFTRTAIKANLSGNLVVTNLELGVWTITVSGSYHGNSAGNGTARPIVAAVEITDVSITMQ